MPPQQNKNALYNDPWKGIESQLASAIGGQDKITFEIAQARKTGKLCLSGASMTTLPDEMFDLRNDLLDKYNGDMDDQNQLNSHEKAWQCYGEEMLTMVDLSENDLSYASSLERMSSFKSLVSLHIRNCKLSSLPWYSLKKNLTSLQVLDAPGNNFVEVPMHLLPESISTLNLAQNRIERLGNDVCLSNLRKLDLHNNKSLVRIPTKLCTPSLQHAYFSQNYIETVPKDFLMSCKTTLQTLDLSENQLTLPMNLIEHSELKVLELRLNKLKSVPLIHENLLKLNLDHNSISSIEGLYPMLQQCNNLGRTQDGDWFRPKLKELYLRKNNLSDLHCQTMAVMTQLSFLDISNNSLETIPSVVGYLRELNKITLDGNPFRIIRSAISYRSQGGIDTEKLMSSLRKKDYPPQGPGYHPDAGYSEGPNGKDMVTPQKVIEAKMLVRRATFDQKSLDISGRNIIGELNWPEIIEALTVETDGTIIGDSVRKLNISDGKISKVGEEWIEALPSLSTLDARRNCLESLPSNLSKLPLKSIIASRNQLSSYVLEDIICIEDSTLCSSLTELDLSSNNLDFIPDSLFDLTALKVLNLSRNKLKSLAWKFDKETGKERGWRHGLINLEYLNLSDNQINDLGYLPLALYGCRSLRTLKLNNNALYDIPLTLGLLEQITDVDLLGNSQRKIGMRVLTQSTSQVLKYLRERMDIEQISTARRSHQEILEALEEEYGLDINVKESNIALQDHDTAKVAESVDLHSPAKNVASTERINELKEMICQTEIELNNLSLSQAKRFALKKELAMQRSQLIREERKLNSPLSDKII